jgi:hypothetical protein
MGKTFRGVMSIVGAKVSSFQSIRKNLHIVCEFSTVGRNIIYYMWRSKFEFIHTTYSP